MGRKKSIGQRVQLNARVAPKTRGNVQQDAKRFGRTRDFIVDSIINEFFSQFSAQERLKIYERVRKRVIAVSQQLSTHPIR